MRLHHELAPFPALRNVLVQLHRRRARPEIIPILNSYLVARKAGSQTSKRACTGMKVMIWMTLLSNMGMLNDVGSVRKPQYQIDGYSLGQEQSYRNGGLVSGIDIKD